MNGYQPKDDGQGGPFNPPTPFLNAAKAQTMLRDFDNLRAAIHAHDSFAAEDAFCKCERWIDQLRPVSNSEILRSGAGNRYIFE